MVIEDVSVVVAVDDADVITVDESVVDAVDEMDAVAVDDMDDVLVLVRVVSICKIVIEGCARVLWMKDRDDREVEVVDGMDGD